jgi:hypothetical protein
MGPLNTEKPRLLSARRRLESGIMSVGIRLERDRRPSAVESGKGLSEKSEASSYALPLPAKRVTGLEPANTH